MKFKVTAVSMSRDTRRQQCKPRKEVVDTKTNELFRGCTNAIQVEQGYEAFWNELNPRSAHIVKVIDVQQI